MASVKVGLGGRGTATTMEREEPHPNSHFEMKEMHIKKAHDGSFIIRHEMGLKKSAVAKPGFDNSYMSRERESETHTAAGHKELMEHMKKHFGVAKPKAAPMPKPGDEEEGEKGEEEPEEEE